MSSCTLPFQIGELGLERKHPVSLQRQRELHAGRPREFSGSAGRKTTEFVEFDRGQHTHFARKGSLIGLLGQ